MNTGRQSGYANVRKDAYDDLVHQLSAAPPTSGSTAPYSIHADPGVGFAKAKAVGFGNFQPKTWWGDLWRATS